MPVEVGRLQIRSTKSEIRSNLKTAMSKIQNKPQLNQIFFCFGHSYFEDLGFVSDFDIRISDFC